MTVLLRRVLLTIVTAAALLWPAYINGGPFWFPDTSNYIRSADAAVLSLTGKPTEWSDRVRLGGKGPVAAAADADEISRSVADLEPTRPVLTGRSIYYGFLLYLPMRAAGPWGAVAVQALIVAALLVGCGAIAARLGLVRRRWLAAILGALVVLSPLPFYTTMLMPDVYAGLMVLALSLAVAFWHRLSRRERVVLILASGVMAAFHTTHLLLALIIGALGALLRLRQPGRAALRPILIVAPVAAIAIAASWVFTFAVTQALHKTPISPPFLTARLISAGPGTAYLRTACARDADAWAVCAYRAKFPVDSDAFLWQLDPAVSVFQVADGDTQRRMAGEDKRFAAAVLRDDPVGVVAVTVRSGVEQLVHFDLMNFNYPLRRIKALPARYPPAIAAEIAETRAAQRTMPTDVTLTTSVLLAILALGAFVWFAFAMRRSIMTTDHGQFALLLFLAVLANAFVCGGLSGPHARYQMRLIWLLPVAAVALMRRRPDHSAALPDHPIPAEAIR